MGAAADAGVTRDFNAIPDRHRLKPPHSTLLDLSILESKIVDDLWEREWSVTPHTPKRLSQSISFFFSFHPQQKRLGKTPQPERNRTFGAEGLDRGMLQNLSRAAAGCERILSQTAACASQFIPDPSSVIYW